MKCNIIVFAVLLLNAFISSGQDKEPSKCCSGIPLVVTATFQNLALPFRDFKSNFNHPGFTIGSELSLNKKGNLVQQLQAGYFRNKEAGNGWLVFSQFTYRPKIVRRFYAELKGGVGWQRIYHPAKAYEFNNGKWQLTAGGKSQLIAPLGITAGYKVTGSGVSISPFISYQVVPALFYNKIIPLNSYSFIQIGSLIYFN